MKKKIGGGGSGPAGDWGSRGAGWSIGRGLVDTNVWGRGKVGYGGCEPRIEGIVQCTKRYCTILRKLKKMRWGGGGAIFEPKTLSMHLKKKKNNHQIIYSLYSISC